MLRKVLLERGESAHAVRFLRESSRGKPGDEETFYVLGKAHYNLREKGDSRDALKRALELNPNAPFATDAKRMMGELK